MICDANSTAFQKTSRFGSSPVLPINVSGSFEEKSVDSMKIGLLAVRPKFCRIQCRKMKTVCRSRTTKSAGCIRKNRVRAANDLYDRAARANKVRQIFTVEHSKPFAGRNAEPLCPPIRLNHRSLLSEPDSIITN